MHAVVVIVGTRPEIIKMAPIFWKLKESLVLTPKIVFTGQHDSLFWENADLLVDPKDIIFLTEQGLNFRSSEAINQLFYLLQLINPVITLVQGDTDSATIGAMSAKKLNFKVGHVEAGLRSHDYFNPWPEEKNRVHISQLSQIHFAPTKTAVENLLREGIEENSIFLTGNPIVDMLESISANKNPLVVTKVGSTKKSFCGNKQYIIVTLHRKELYAEGRIENVFKALTSYLNIRDNIEILFFLHKNPTIKEKILTSYQRNKHENIILCEPCNFFEMQTLLKSCFFVVTDSGGLQEESAYHGKFCCIVRTNTERIESVNHKIAKLCGYSFSSILDGMLEARSIPDSGKNKWLYGDGRASQKIVKIIERTLPNSVYYDQES